MPSASNRRLEPGNLLRATGCRALAWALISADFGSDEIALFAATEYVAVAYCVDAVINPLAEHRFQWTSLAPGVHRRSAKRPYHVSRLPVVLNEPFARD